jgi:hypothetical protein
MPEMQKVTSTANLPPGAILMVRDPSQIPKVIRGTIPNNFTPREYQLPFMGYMDNPKRLSKRAVIVWHRKSGKTKTVLAVCIKEMFKRVGMYFHCFPEYSQGRKIVWEGMDGEGFPFLQHFPPTELASPPNNTEMKVEIKNGSIYRIIGADNYESSIGPNPIGIILDEYSLSDRYKAAWDHWRPILAQNGGWAIFCFTPRGRNHAYDIYQIARANQDWFCELLTADQTQGITKEAIEKERRDGMSDDLIEQEFYCSFKSSIAQILVPWEDIQAAIDRPAFHSGGHRIAGVDVARFGDDKSVLIVRQGGRITYSEAWAKMDTVFTAGRIRELYRQGEFDSVAVDVTGGLGSGPYDMLNGWNVPCAPVNASERAASRGDFQNMRADLGWSVREWFTERACSLSDTPNSEKIVADTQDIHYFYNPSSGKKQIESKEDLKKPDRLGRSPDWFDALSYTFYPVPIIEKGDKNRQREADHERP